MALSTAQQPLRTLGNWELLEKIAGSGMGTVYKARSHLSGEVVAVKVLPPFQVGNHQAYQRFARECRLLSALHDPYIVRAVDFGIEGSDPYLVMEFVEGERLSERVAREGPLPEEEAIRLIAQVAGALDRMHSRKLVHRNVMPDSILITPDGQAKLTDLGLIKEVESHDAFTRDGAVLGTPNYMAPEHIRNAARAGRRCDIYGLAATLYLAVTGEPPFGGCNMIELCTRKTRDDLVGPKTLVPALREQTDQAIRQAMKAQPDLRPSSCEDFIASLSGPDPVKATISPREEDGNSTAGQTGHVAVEPDGAQRGGSQVTAETIEHNGATSSAWLWLVGLALVSAFVSGLCFLSRS